MCSQLHKNALSFWRWFKENLTIFADIVVCQFPLSVEKDRVSSSFSDFVNEMRHHCCDNNMKLCYVIDLNNA